MLHEELVMGTVITLDVRAKAGIDEQELIMVACRELHEADRLFSTFDPQSMISRVRRGELTDDAHIPSVLGEVLGLCARARELSGGFFDPWSMPGGVDPTGLVKGWAAERALERLQVPGVTGGLVNAAGDIAAFGAPAPGQDWRVGLQDPRDRSRLLGAVMLSGALASSGTYERGAHILDPVHGQPASQGSLSASVTGPSLAIADALATGLFAAGVDGLAWIDAADGYEGFLLHESGMPYRTPGFSFA